MPDSENSCYWCGLVLRYGYPSACPSHWNQLLKEYKRLKSAAKSYRKTLDKVIKEGILTDGELVSPTPLLA